MNNMPSNVSSFLDASHVWITQALLDSFGPIMAAVITLIPRDHVGNSGQLVWKHSENSRMMAAAIYNEESSDPATSSEEIWRLRAQPRFLMTIWRAANSQLPTNSWLHSHRLREDVACPCGCRDPETANHVFSNCKFISMVWKECARMASIGPFSSFNNLLDSFFAEIELHRSSPKA